MPQERSLMTNLRFTQKARMVGGYAADTRRFTSCSRVDLETNALTPAQILLAITRSHFTRRALTFKERHPYLPAAAATSSRPSFPNYLDTHIRSRGRGSCVSPLGNLFEDVVVSGRAAQRCRREVKTRGDVDRVVPRFPPSVEPRFPSTYTSIWVRKQVAWRIKLPILKASSQ